jgi:transposase InsO family protein
VFVKNWVFLSEKTRLVDFPSPPRAGRSGSQRERSFDLLGFTLYWGRSRKGRSVQQIIEAFPWDTAPKYLLRDRDAIYGSQFQKRVKSMGIEEVLPAPRSPWQNAFVERVIGSIRRDCLDHVVVLNERHLKRILTSYFYYHHRWRTHLSLGMDTPESRLVQLPALGKVVEFPEVGGLHHHYGRLAAW